MNEHIAPDGWLERLHSNLDFETSYLELEGYNHFYSSTLRAVLCLYRTQHEDALRHAAMASEIFPGLDDANEEDQRRYLFNWAVRFDAQRLMEAKRGTLEANKTDELARRVASLSGLDGQGAVRLRRKVLAFHHVLRGRFEEARDVYAELIKNARRSPEFGVVSYMGAAAVAHELGLFKEARQHYENGELCMSFSSDRLNTLLYSAILQALCKHWGWENESQRWSDTIDAIATKETTRLCMHEHSRLIYVGVASGLTATAL